MPEYIEREEALRQMRDSKDDKPKYGDWDIAHDCCIDIVENIPNADVAEVKHGEWIFVYKESTMHYEVDGCRCSHCNCIEEMQNKMPFCPNCGAKMDGKKN